MRAMQSVLVFRPAAVRRAHPSATYECIRNGNFAKGCAILNKQCGVGVPIIRHN